jgi:hypothetical protein
VYEGGEGYTLHVFTVAGRISLALPSYAENLILSSRGDYHSMEVLLPKVVTTLANKLPVEQGAPEF